MLLTLRTGNNGPALTELIDLLGHVTVLERPLAATSLKSAVLAAVRGRRRQRQAEQYLRQLKQLADTLERRVEERTEQLSEANKRLRDEMVERERTEVALRQAQKMEAVGQLTGGIAHDFNNLLMAIIGNLELIARRVEDERVQRYVRNAMHGAQRGAKLVGQLLTFSRKQRLAPEPVDVNQLVGTVAEMLSRTLGASIRVDVVTHKDLWPALVDATQLELMLLNLAINARDAMPEGGLLTIETNVLHGVPEGLQTELKPGEYVSIAVKDTGTGMPPEVLARAFDPFFTTKEPGKGTGLGLSQVYGFARQSGGTAKIESQVGRGTVVRILLPRSTDVVVGGEDRQLSPPSVGAREHILVVDDDASVLETTRSMLDDLGYQAIAADNLDAALATLSHQAIDLAIIDLAMPGVSGLDVGLELQRQQPGLPVVYCSGSRSHRRNRQTYERQCAPQQAVFLAGTLSQDRSDATHKSQLLVCLSQTHANATEIGVDSIDTGPHHRASQLEFADGLAQRSTGSVLVSVRTGRFQALDVLSRDLRVRSDICRACKTGFPLCVHGRAHPPGRLL
ncbi:ATP-binding protein [Bradyrhizobium sp. B117]|uniref:ATP-binding protein n=1 Tax=Bradyrhizobium sp. B117 TaxID=3140246 RepID=UPI003182F8DD